MHESLVRKFYEKCPKSRFAVMFTGILYVGTTTGFMFGIVATLMAGVYYLCEGKNDVCRTIYYEGLKLEKIHNKFIYKATNPDSGTLLAFFTLSFNFVTVSIMRDVHKKKFRPGLAYLLSAILGVDLVCEGYNIYKWFEIDFIFDFSFLILFMTAFFISAQLVVSTTIFMHYVSLSAEKENLLVDQDTELIVDTQPEPTTLAPCSEISKECGPHAHDNELI